MFRSYAYRYLKQQKKHTVLTVTAIIIAVAFMTVMLSAVSIYNETYTNITKSTTGSYHVLFNSLDRDATVLISNMEIFDEIETYGVSYYSSSTEYVFDADTTSKQYLYFGGMIIEGTFLRYKSDSVSMLPDSMTNVIEGRLPEKDGEIVLNAGALSLFGNPSIGDTLTFYTIDCSEYTEATDNSIYNGIPEYFSSAVQIDGYSEVTFTVVGFSEGYNIIHYNDSQFKSGTESYNNLLARFTDDCDSLYWDMDSAFSALGYEIDNFDYSMNESLIYAEGLGDDAKANKFRFLAVCYIFILFLMFCVRMVIDNSFEISSRERVKQFGLLKAVGASASQIFFIIVWEATLLSIIGVPIGMLIGTGVTYAIFNAISSMDSLNSISSIYTFTDKIVFHIEWYVYIISLVIGFGWVIISAVGTGMRVIKATPVDAMRMASKKEKIYTGKFRMKLGNGKKFIPVYASLSLKRNKKRYFITMLSMVLSIILFSGFSYAIDLAKQNISNTYEYEKLPYDFTITTQYYSSSGADYVVSLLEETGLFEDIQYDTYISLYVDTADIGVTTVDGDSGYAFLYIHPINRSTYEKYITADVTYDELVASGTILIGANNIDNNTIVRNIDSVEPSEATATQFIIAEMNPYGGDATIQVSGLYFTENSMYLGENVIIAAIIPEENYNDLMAQCGRDATSTVYEYTDATYILYTRDVVANVKDGCLEDARTYLAEHFYGFYTDNINDRESSESILSLVSMAGYFLIIVFSLIATVNVANIISTNVLNRFSELGILRACGMDNKQLYSMIRLESLIYAILAGMSSAIAIVVMILLIQIPFENGWGYLTENDLLVTLSATAPLKYVALSSIVALIVAVCSSYFPAKRIINSPVVESIKDVE